MQKSALGLLAISTCLSLSNCRNVNRVPADAKVADSYNQNNSSSLASRVRPFVVSVINREKQNGSGVIVEKRANQYTVYTNSHVLFEVGDSGFIRTHDGTSYPFRVQRDFRGSNPGDRTSIDVAILTFQADASYPLAPLRPSQEALQPGEMVMTAGYPNDLGGTNFVTHTGKFVGDGQKGFSLPSKGVCQNSEATGGQRERLGNQEGDFGHFVGTQGYALALCANQDKGMSGGATVDNQGRVIGLNGRHSYPSWGSNNLFTTISGDKLTPPQIEKLEQFSWSIPTRYWHANQAPESAPAPNHLESLPVATPPTEEVTTPAAGGRDPRSGEWGSPSPKTGDPQPAVGPLW